MNLQLDTTGATVNLNDTSLLKQSQVILIRNEFQVGRFVITSQLNWFHWGKFLKPRNFLSSELKWMFIFEGKTKLIQLEFYSLILEKERKNGL